MPGCLLAAVLAAAAAADDTARRLDAIQVLARPPAAAVTAQVAQVDSEAIERVAPSHPNPLFARVPGAWISRGSGQESLIALRSPVLTGAGACGAFALLEDGVPIRPVGLCNVNELFELQFEQAAAVEVLRGPGTTLLGSNALHGAINVRPHAPGASPVRAVSLDAGAHRFRRARATIAAADARVEALAAESGSFRRDESWSQHKLRLQWQWPGASGSPRALLALTRLDQETAGFVFGENAFADARRFGNANPEAFRDAQAARMHLRWLWPVAAGELGLTPYVRRDRMEFLQHFLPGAPLERNGSDSAGVQLRWSSVSGRNDHVLGLDLERARGTLLELQAGPVQDGPPALREIRPPGRHYDYAVDADHAALFARTGYAATPSLRIEAGVRAETLRYRYENRMAAGNLREDGGACGFGGCLFNRPADRVDRFDEVNGELGLVHAGADSEVFARVARAFRFPQAGELYRLQRGQDVADLAPEVLHGIEAGWRHFGAVRTEVAAYAYDKRHVILRDAQGFNVADGRTTHRGLEAAVHWAPVDAAWVEGNLGYAIHRYAFDRALAGGETIDEGNEIDSAPRWLGAVRLGHRGRAGTFELEWLHQGGYFLDAANSARYDGHRLLHLRWQRELGAGWSLGARILNLADRRYAERADFAFGNFRYFPGEGRRWELELRYWAH
ncbi:MAG TPA: TonB-dependent receptor [Xanthomonadaceae bacterium]|nr:TonB-dependent receptor [Xanthomonadaceae bacterium]